MNMSLDIAWKSLNKKKEELCGDTVEIIKTEDSDILLLSDGMGSGVKANILSTLTTKIMGTMLKNGASIEECVTTIARTLPVCQTRHVAYSTFSVLQIYRDGKALLLEYDNPGGILIRGGRHRDVPFSVREIEGKIIREYHFNVCYGDYYVMMSDGVIHAGVGKKSGFGWPRVEVVRYVEDVCASNISSSRLMSMISNRCNMLYDGEPGDDTTVITIKVTRPKTVNLFTGPPVNKADDVRVMKAFMARPGRKIVCGGTSSQIAARYLNQEMTNNNDGTKDVPPTANIRELDLVTEGVLTMSHTFKLLRQFDEGDIDAEFFEALDADNGGARLARILLEECTELNFFVGKANNQANYDNNQLFDISVRRNLVVQIRDAMEHMGKQVNITYY